MKKIIMPLVRLITLAALSTVALLSSAQAANYYLQRDQGSGWNWNTIGHNTGWWTAPTGGAMASSIDPEGTYYTNGRALRTPEGGSLQTFGGNLLVLDNGGTLMLKSNASGSALINAMQAESGSTITASTGSHYHNLTINNFNIAGDIRFFTSLAGRSIGLSLGNVIGSGNITLDGVATTDNFRIDAINAATYTGTVTLNTGTLRLDSDLVTAGALVLSETARVELSHSITVNSLTIGGTALDYGVYDFNYLSSNFGETFLGGDFSANSITVVPETAQVASTIALLCAASMLWMRRRRR